MIGETNLNKLIKHMSPQLNEGTFVFCTVPTNFDTKHHRIIATFLEHEDKTLVLEQTAANELNLLYSNPMAWITLQIHSSLDAVGLTAAFSTALSSSGISCNVMAGFYHDHIFVPYEDAEKAIKTLLRLSF